jgi:hypothetical protein
MRSTPPDPTTHGHSAKGKQSPTYMSWAHMKHRCRAKTGKHYKDYVLRGITVCERWNKFENFLEDMGERPEGCTLDRVDNDKGYFKNNCRWATRKEQFHNSRLNQSKTTGRFFNVEDQSKPKSLQPERRTGFNGPAVVRRD